MRGKVFHGDSLGGEGTQPLPCVQPLPPLPALPTERVERIIDFARGVLISVSWGMRHMHIALDTLVLYGVLGGSSRGTRKPGGLITSIPCCCGHYIASMARRNVSGKYMLVFVLVRF